MMRRNLLHSACGVVLLSVLTASPGFAHEQTGVGGGLAAGLLHPLTGLDHLVAMVAVGIWGAQLGGAAIWVLPIVFPLVMALGAVVGILKIGLPVPELVIALSALVLGLAVALRVRAPFVLAAAVVAVFAIFHGHAHGAELPSAANPLAYGCGFVVATGLLHAFGITIGALARWPGGERVIQGVGAAIAALGGYFLVTSLGVAA
ncbi:MULTISPECIES: HupE/UreJ family protein [Bradyrhizobium]|jgi:urease accessory protein|uniref:HupE/UreJ family protein n=1 Tax=Bradyrhizobium denitrificans TaxID=2734912 RepID=A0ABS5GEN0_9BRAD|nr:MULTISPECIES: HupE/UreJ family protein [Bradyrhizobium]MBR1139792.1 HupE/UreJ family protein [Bradyrhizobium denitrificans]MDU0959331.1 HupE/UreJ family protein [Bradyrhizobium sp.]MDU1493881.1 HupE/UreJ family protein [Bradyrhizobium sp.]MDU1547570.1 HupE/UreJ family protein [Bradyrhizobium sp.]MDU1694654.1 HupE/UreJ family protein [Bradyrhizobium sp.]